MDNEEVKEQVENSTVHQQDSLERNPEYTYFDEVYEVFLNSIDSYELVAIAEDELENTLLGYLDVACDQFINYIAQDFYDKDFNEKHFNFKLTRYEMVMLAKAMKLAWVRTKKYSEELMSKAIGDRDYQAVQGYKYLEQLQVTERNLDKEIKLMIQAREFGDEEILGNMVSG